MIWGFSPRGKYLSKCPTNAPHFPCVSAPIPCGIVPQWMKNGIFSAIPLPHWPTVPFAPWNMHQNPSQTLTAPGRSPVQILAHMGDLFLWAISMAQGNPAWHNTQPIGWPQEQQRFFAALSAFDAYLASSSKVHAPIERLMQGPVTDALCHSRPARHAPPPRRLAHPRRKFLRRSHHHRPNQLRPARASKALLVPNSPPAPHNPTPNPGHSRSIPASFPLHTSPQSHT